MIAIDNRRRLAAGSFGPTDQVAFYFKPAVEKFLDHPHVRAAVAGNFRNRNATARTRECQIRKNLIGHMAIDTGHRLQLSGESHGRFLTNRLRQFAPCAEVIHADKRVFELSYDAQRSPRGKAGAIVDGGFKRDGRRTEYTQGTFNLSLGHSPGFEYSGGL